MDIIVQKPNPSMVAASDLKWGLVYQVAGSESTYVMKVNLGAGTGNRVINLETGYMISEPHRYSYLLVKAELVVS